MGPLHGTFGLIRCRTAGRDSSLLARVTASLKAMSRLLSPLVVLPLAKLLVHLASHRGYGYFRDEFYYLACAERLAWGYVDQPPLSLALLAVQRALFGDSLLALRLLPAVAGALTVLLVGLMARRLGGGRFAQTLAMLGALAAPIYLALDHFYSMNAFDLLFWALAAYLLILLLEGGDRRLWLVLGAVLGLGLLNKISVLWLGAGLLAGLLLSAERRLLRTPWPWLAVAIAGLLFLPHVVWQVANGWPTLEFIRNATGQKMLDVAPLDFARSQIRIMNPVLLPLWLGGLAWLLRHPEGRRFRLLGWTWVAVFVLLAVSRSSRAGYLSPAYTWLLAGGGVLWEELFERWRRPVLRWVAAGLVVLAGLVMAPLALPVLPVERYVAYAEALGVAPSTAERKELAELPQFYADMHGWEEIVATAAEVFEGLSPAEREQATIFTFNYGNAGAVDLLGRRRGLPPALSGHNNYWLWGPRGASGEVVIFLGGDREDFEPIFDSVERAATIECGYCMPYENHRPVWVARGPQVSFEEIWPRLKHYD